MWPLLLILCYNTLRMPAQFIEKDAKKLHDFSDLCDSVADQMDQLPGLNCLNYPKLIRPLVMKLHKSIQRKWDERVVEFALLKDDLYPDFKEFAAEVKKRARLKNHPNVRKNIWKSKDGSTWKTQSKGCEEDEHNRVFVRNADSGLPYNQVKHCQFHNQDGYDILECKAFAKDFAREI